MPEQNPNHTKDHRLTGQLSGLISRVLDAGAFGVSRTSAMKQSREVLSRSHLSALREQYLVGSSNSKRLRVLSQNWIEAQNDFKWGRFRESVLRRNEVLEEVYSLQWGSTDWEMPIGLSYEFGTNIGHLAITLAHASAAEEGFFGHNDKFVLPVEPTFYDNGLLKTLSPHVIPIKFSTGAKFSEMPTFWHAFQRLQTWRTIEGFEDLYVFMDRYLGRRLSAGAPPFKLPEAEVSEARAELSKSFGIPSDAWIVGLHVRDDGLGPNRRNQDVQGYLPAIDEITGRGGWVVRIGDPKMPELPEMSKVIDLTRLSPSMRYLDIFVLTSSTAFIGTQSGPSSIPPLFGVPTLITNSTSVGRNALNWGPNSIYLPKLLAKSHNLAETLPLSEQLQTPDGFGELSSKELESMGYVLVNNDPTQIRDAVVELLEGSNPNHRNLNCAVDSIRNQFWFTSSGKFSESFLDANPKWIG